MAQNSEKVFLSVILSFRNEEKNIPELVRRLTAAIQSVGVSYELLFINDASTDRSLELLTDLMKFDPHIKVVNFSRRFGNAPGHIAGFEYSSGEAVLMMDSDLQDPPELIPKLLEEFRKGYDVVYTTRLSRSGEPPLKIWLTKMAYRILRATTNINLPLDSGDFKLLSRRVVQELIRLREKDPFMRGLVSWVGFRQAQVFYHREARHAGTSNFPILTSRAPIVAFIGGLTSFSNLPLNLALIVGFLVSAISFLYLGVILVMFFLGWNIPGWTALMGVILILGGTQLLTIGTLGLYIGRIYNEVKPRPHYIVESTLGFIESSK